MTTVIFDGDCDFCRSCVKWVQRRMDIEALPNQSANLQMYGVTKEDCEKSVVVIDSEIYFAARAVSFLLLKSGHRAIGNLLKLSGPVGECGYRYIASHRDGTLVRILHWFIRRSI